MGMPSMPNHSDTFQNFPGEKSLQKSSSKGPISVRDTTIPPLTPGWASFQIQDTANAAESTVQTVSTTTEPSTFGLGSSLNFASHAILPNYNDNILTPRGSEVDREEATIDLNHINWEHHGPGSWLSICSDPGVRWVISRTGTNGFDQIAHDLIGDWTKHLTLSQLPIGENSPEPDIQTAWQYCTAFFDHTHDPVLAVVYRPEFEAQLRLHFQRPRSPDEDVAWYALRNAIYAVGCRAAASTGNAKDFHQIQQKSLKFFHNAFSVYTNLLYMPSGLTAVQALVIMTSYAELMASPAVEYMLCASAARLAQSKGLHRQPSKAWKLPTNEILHRNWTFWAIYCHDKYLALRSGRPPTLNDDDISCEIPTTIPVGSTIDHELFTAIIKHAQICALMIQQLFSVKTFNQAPEALFNHLDNLDCKLEDWHKSLPKRLLPSEANDSSHRRGSDIKETAKIIRLHNEYYGSIIALHANFHYPWICSLLLNHNELTFRDRIFHSSTRTAEASRKILASLKDTTPDSNSSSPVVFYYPMLAIINLFIYVLKYPTLPFAQSELAFLDIGVGHFGLVHYLTSAHVSFSFPREAAGIADKAVKDAKLRLENSGEESGEHNYAHLPTGMSDLVT
ncbi:hypothetical protein N7510_000747 [Penicillium lagena]|uniref:uncharacterized protein n=1 Tax=Penicillium lagena TaxID=94218 RepID=UPI002541E9DA|nr:uncharacterized protein N7510_000747 [Penicillium lagena]KAJ5624438.1 hypothetical protein N7510_000747 [Penicillium lagena]